ncbi:hypothetical protein IFM47457_06297 [Aspergillus lentulus]|nr:hypothetical protein IFM47457_06297 [Aspergillus lentulus]
MRPRSALSSSKRGNSLATALVPVDWSWTAGRIHQELVCMRKTAEAKSGSMNLNHSWASRNNVDITKEVTSEAHQNAILLYRRGVEYKEGCKTSAPEIEVNQQYRAFFSGACANCVWNNNAASCSYYIDKNRGWDTRFDTYELPSK